SSRLYREGDASYMTANILYHAETPVPQTTAVTFMRTPRAVVTLRFADPLSLRQFVARAQRQPSLSATADAALCGILDSDVVRAADEPGVAGKDVDGVSRAIVGYGRRDD